MRFITGLLLAGLVCVGIEVSKAETKCSCHGVSKDQEVLAGAPMLIDKATATVETKSGDVQKNLYSGGNVWLGAYPAKSVKKVMWELQAKDPDDDVCEPGMKDIYANLQAKADDLPRVNITRKFNGTTTTIDPEQLTLKDGVLTATWEPKNTPGEYTFTLAGTIEDMYTDHPESDDSPDLTILSYLSRLELIDVDIEQSETNVCWRTTNVVLNLTAGSCMGSGTALWTSNPEGISGSGTSIKFDASKLPPGSYVVTAASSLIPSCSDTCIVRIYRLSILSVAPDSPIPLGDDATIKYKLEGTTGVSLNQIGLVVKNAAGTVVFARDDLDKTDGEHTTTWDDVKWNQAPHTGAYANPNNGPYALQIVGKKGGTVYCASDEVAIDTRFIVEADIKDVKAGTASEAAGLSDLADTISVTVTQGTDKRTFGIGEVPLTDITDGKHVRIDHDELNALGDGSWEMELKNVRDEIGNFVDTNPSTPSVEHFRWAVELR